MKLYPICVTVLLAGASAAAAAREAEVAVFTAPEPQPSQAAASFGSVPPDDAGAVRASLMAAFETFATGARPGPEAFIPPSRISAAGWPLRSSGPPQTNDQPDLACTNAVYRPTWWNPPATERRRAIYFAATVRIACEFALPRRLLDALVAQESGYNPGAVSSAGAMGMMQIMPGTARKLGLARPFDPIASLRAGAGYLRQQFERFGRFDLALAAYNAGPERQALKRGLVPAIPETRSYVRAILINWERLIELDQGLERMDRAGMVAGSAKHAAPALRATHYRSLERIPFGESTQSPAR